VLYLPVSVLSALLNDLDLCRREVKERIDASVQVGLHSHDRLGAGAVLGAAGLEPLLPVVTVFDGDVTLEGLLDLAAEDREVEIPSSGELLVELAVRRSKIGQNAPARPAVEVIASAGGANRERLSWCF
jgi:hypothetical protein